MRSLARIAMGSMWVKSVGLSRNGSLNTSKLWDTGMTRMGLLSALRVWITVLTGRRLASQTTEQFYWKRRIQEALQIQSHPITMNLDCGLSLSHFWLPLIKPPWTIFHLFIYFSPLPFSFYPFIVFNLFKSLYHTHFSVVPYWRRFSIWNIYGY